MHLTRSEKRDIQNPEGGSGFDLHSAICAVKVSRWSVRNKSGFGRSENSFPRSCHPIDNVGLSRAVQGRLRGTKNVDHVIN